VIFAVFEEVLSELDSTGHEVFGEGWHPELQAALEGLSQYYGNQNLRNPNRDLVDYSGLPTQAAYVFMYAIGRAEFTYQLLKRFRQKHGKPLFAKNALNVTSIGGGPASELVGLIRYLDDPVSGEDVVEILYDVIDKEGEWNSVAELVVGAIPTGIEITATFYQADLADPAGVKERSVEYDDLVMMSFFISEICELPNPKEVRANLEILL
jgi:hypothetical protein